MDDGEEIILNRTRGNPTLLFYDTTSSSSSSGTSTTIQTHQDLYNKRYQKQKIIMLIHLQKRQERISSLLNAMSSEFSDFPPRSQKVASF